ncbi:Uncharacterized membrane protein YeiH [Humidesulfovibrio mexicanus]|uniref:Uncharacterized membrane protein YeiH n=1 Tax=Humidesulfovibrio mexicanus TaxID=147047 RepID=A0A239BQX0_9BACT|nr:trimeric intracellular cation channel family protein [Humidesulfovibrio mexicanus]SNS10455.1 Uncharacterized membrane protein YeiH [Humidesulfovibrio mexicanus]
MDIDILTPALRAASLAGGAAFALSGFLAGVRKKLDLMGVFILSLLTASGGGAMRDVLLGQPVALVRQAEPFLVAGGVALLALALRLHRLPRLERRTGFVVSDAVGLSAFALSGALAGVEADAPFFGVLALALLTAVGGGILRDLLVNEVPEVLRGGFYGSVALLVGAAVFGLNALRLLTPAALVGVFASGLGLRLLAYKRGWGLPRPSGAGD